MHDETTQGPEEVRQPSAGAGEAMTSPADIHRWIEEEGVIEGYLQNRLDPQDLAVFEEHYLGCADCVRQLEMAERFEDAFRGVVVEEAMASAAITRLGVLASVGRWMARRPLLIAAPWLLLVGFATLGWQLAGERDRLTSELVQMQQPRPVTAPLLLDVVRSTEVESPAPTLLVDPAAGPRQLLLAVVTEGLMAPGASAGSQSAAVTATLSSEAGEALWHGTDLVPSDGLLQLAVPSELLSVGAYRLEVRRQDADAEDPESRLELAFQVAEPAP